MNLFEAFNIEEPKAVTPKELKKVKGEKIKSKSTKKPSKAKEALSGEVEINHETIIRFEGITHPITVYFTDEEIEAGILETNEEGKESRRKVTSEDIRKRMEEGTIQVDEAELNDMGLFGLQGYVDLVPSITKIHVEKDKNMIIPVKQAGKKGLGQGNRPRLPKIPFQLIMDFWRYARLYAAEYKVEIHADLYWNASERQYILDYPKQRCERLNVEVLYTDPFLSAEMKKILEIHSHHEMLPLPSSQDNLSERCPGMLYMIVGGYKETKEHDPYVFQTGRLFPDITIRTFHNDEHIALNLWDFIEHPFNDVSFLNQLEVVGNE